MMIRRSIRGTFFMGEKDQKSMEGYYDGGIQCVNTRDQDYVDDVNLCIESEEDLLIVDEIFTKFEDLSGAILNRDYKTKIMGIGEWVGKVDWCLPWIKVEPSLRIFGIIFHPTYSEILEDNWKKAVEGFSDCVLGWKMRALDTIFQRVEVLKTFALPKLWYKAQLLPLPGKVASQLEEKIRNFVWQGKLEKPAYVEMCNMVEDGGLGLPCVRSKADSLLLKQTLRMLEDKNADHHSHLRFWLGSFMGNWGDLNPWGQPNAKRSGIVVDGPLRKESALTPHYEKLLTELKYGEKNEYFYDGNIRQVTAKMLYKLNTTTFTPPAITYKRNVPDWKLVWNRVGSLMMEPRGREISYMVVNNVYPTQERLNRINMDKAPDKRRVWTPICQNCKQGVVEDSQHMFMECDRVKEGWLWVRRRIQTLLVDMQGLSNYELLMLTFPKEVVENEVVWLIGQWLQMVHDEVVVKGRNMGDQLVRGHFRYKYLESLTMKMPQLNHIQDVTVIDPG